MDEMPPAAITGSPASSTSREDIDIASRDDPSRAVLVTTAV